MLWLREVPPPACGGLVSIAAKILRAGKNCKGWMGVQRWSDFSEEAEHYDHSLKSE